MTLTGWDISADHAVPSTDGVTIAGFRACLGLLTDQQLAHGPQHFVPQLAETLHRAPDIITQDYLFLSGPKRGHSMADQIAFYKTQHRCELSCLDWEDDSYTVNGVTFHMGRQSPAAVLAGVKLAQAAGLNVAVYASLSVLKKAVVKALIAAGVPMIWVAAYGVPIPGWLIKACQDAGIILLHQHTGEGVDRSRVLVGTIEQLHALAGRASNPAPGPAPITGDPMTNLAPLTAHRVVDIAAGGVLFKTPGGDRFTTLPADITLGFLGSTPTHYHVADGDAGVYLARDDPKFKAIRTADQNVGQ